MNCYLVQTLQNMASVAVAVNMYQDKDIQDMLTKDIDCLFPDNYIHYRRRFLFQCIERKAQRKWPYLPESLVVRSSKFLRAIHTETELWVRDHKDLLGLDAEECYLVFKSCFCWKSDGTINRPQTARVIVLSFRKKLDPATCFELAAVYFLADRLNKLWLEHANLIKRVPANQLNIATQFWITYLKRKHYVKDGWERLIDGHFSYPTTICCPNLRVRVSSFFHLLSWEGKQKYFQLLQTGYKTHQDDLRLCLKSMNAVERSKFYSSFPEWSLRCALKSPLPHFSHKMAQELQKHMDSHQFYFILHYVVGSCIPKGFGHFDYIDFVKQFWKLVPTSVKKELKETDDFFVIQLVLDYKEEIPLNSFVKKLEDCVADLIEMDS